MADKDDICEERLEPVAECPACGAERDCSCEPCGGRGEPTGESCDNCNRCEECCECDECPACGAKGGCLCETCPECDEPTMSPCDQCDCCEACAAEVFGPEDDEEECAILPLH